MIESYWLEYLSQPMQKALIGWHNTRLVEQSLIPMAPVSQGGMGMEGRAGLRGQHAFCHSR